MSNDLKYPLFLRGYYKETLWGGTGLKRLFSYENGGKNIAEAWILSCREKEKSVIKNGIYKGKSLEEFLVLCKGSAGTLSPGNHFPLLVKFIDANDKLSVQVHPDNEYATANEKEPGKSEFWYILQASHDSEILYGIKEDADLNECLNSLGRAGITDYLNTVKVKEKDRFFIPPGQIHALGKNILILEVQQNSDLTYRIYDYDRICSDGTKRELHINKAEKVIKRYSGSETKSLNMNGKIKRRSPIANAELLSVNDYFRVCKISEKTREVSYTVDETSFLFLTFLKADKCIIEHKRKCYDVMPGDAVFLPASCGTIVISGFFEAVSVEL